jgi:hypothetical protein
MSRTKGSHNKHKKEKPVKEKKKRGRPSKQHQYQHQTVNVNVNSDGGGGSTSRKPHLPIQLPTSIFDPSLVTPHYGINDRQPVNPQTDTTDLLTPFLQSILTNQTHNQQQVMPNQPKQPQPQPVVITQPTQPQPIPIPISQPKPKPIEPTPKPEKPDFTHDDVQQLIDQIHHKQEKEIPQPIPQNTPHKQEKQIFYDIFGLPINSNLGQTINDKYDGLKLKNKTMPWSDVASGTFTGITGGIATGLAGPSIVNNALAGAASYVGYQIAGEKGAAIGNLLAAAAVDQINPSYASTTNKQTHTSDYEEILSHPNQRVNGGTVVATTNIKQQKPSHKEPKKTKMLISKLGDALKEVSSSSDQVPVSQRIKESKLLKDLEKQQKTYGTIQTTDVKPQAQAQVKKETPESPESPESQESQESEESENSTMLKEDRKVENRVQSVSDDIKKLIIKKESREPEPVQSDSQQHGYCYIGKINNSRYCAKVLSKDNCMSGDIFPTMAVCINPNLRT